VPIDLFTSFIEKLEKEKWPRYINKKT